MSGALAVNLPGSRAPSGRLLAAVAGLAVVAGLAALSPAQAARAVDDGDLGIRPSNGSDYFRLRMSPGTSLDATAIVTNHTAQPTTLTTYSVDGATAKGGAFILNAKSAPRVGVGRWAHLAAPKTTVPARSEASIPFVITVPKEIPEGDYLGGVVIETLAVGGITSAGENTATRVDVIHRQGVRIYLTVAARMPPPSSLRGATVTPKKVDLHGPDWPAGIAVAVAVSGLTAAGLVAWRGLRSSSRRRHNSGERH